MVETNANWDKLLPGAGSDLGAACGQEERESRHIRAALEGSQGDPCSAEELPLLLTVVNC